MDILSSDEETIAIGKSGHGLTQGQVDAVMNMLKSYKRLVRQCS